MMMMMIVMMIVLMMMMVMMIRREAKNTKVKLKCKTSRRPGRWRRFSVSSCNTEKQKRPVVISVAPLWRLIQQQQQQQQTATTTITATTTTYLYNINMSNAAVITFCLLLRFTLWHSVFYFISFSFFSLAFALFFIPQLETFDANLCPANGHGMLTCLETETETWELRTENSELQLQLQLQSGKLCLPHSKTFMTNSQCTLVKTQSSLYVSISHVL